MSYFQLFDLPDAFEIDEAALKQAYFSLQRQHHPDKAGIEGVQKSMELNQAYQTLMNPIKRGQHLLSLYGVDVGHDHSRIKPSMELLEEMMEKREAVMSLENSTQAEAFLRQTEENYDNELLTFATWAQNLDKNKEDAAQSLLRLQYITKLQSELKQQIKQLEKQNG